MYFLLNMKDLELCIFVLAYQRAGATWGDARPSDSDQDGFTIETRFVAYIVMESMLHISTVYTY